MAVFLSNGLFLSEILADNAGSSAFDTDGDGGANKADEFIEIQSVNGSTVNLDGIQIWSAKRGLLYEFGPGDTIASGGTATVVGQYDGAEPPGFYDAGLPDNNSNSGLLEDGEANKYDTLYILDTNTGEYIEFLYGDNPTPVPVPFNPTGTTLVGSETFASGAPNGTSFARDANGDWVEDSTPDPGTPGAVCFTAGTLIETDRGPRPIETLAAGNLIVTRDNGLQPLRWIGERHLRRVDLMRQPHLAPVHIAAGALGPGLPRRDLIVSPQHRVLVRSRISERMFGATSVLIPAVKLLDLPGVSRPQPQGPVRYFHLLLDRHEVVLAEGCPSESLLIGPMAKRLLSPEALAELTALFPEVMEPGAMDPVRPIPRNARVKQLVRRHAANQRRSLIETAA
jgi:hypothetical protein